MRIHYPSVILSGLCGYALLILWGTWNGPLDLPEDRREVVSSKHEKAEGPQLTKRTDLTPIPSPGPHMR
jgi:hypothetical protein